MFETNEKFSTKVQQLKNKVDELDQKSLTLENMVEIVSVPIIRNEDCKSVVKEITKSLKIEYNLVKAYRISTKHNTNMKMIA